MINKYVAMGFGALIALAPVALSVDVAQAATDSTSAAAPTTATHHHVRRKGHTAGHRARASAHHVHKKMTAPAEAPKS